MPQTNRAGVLRVRATVPCSQAIRPAASRKAGRVHVMSLWLTSGLRLSARLCRTWFGADGCLHPRLGILTEHACSSTGPWARASSARATRRQLPPPKLLPHGHCAGLRQRRSKTHSGSLPVGAAVASFPALCRPASRRVIVQAPPGAPCGRLAQLQSLPCPAVQHCRACLWPQCENRGPLRICCGPSFSVHFLSGRRVGVTCAGC